jgi:hypothetical protein
MFQFLRHLGSYFPQMGGAKASAAARVDEIVAAHAEIIFEMPNHRLDGGEHGFDGFAGYRSSHPLAEAFAAPNPSRFRLAAQFRSV